jgi:CDP-glucose 4,6-dehydratase
MFKANILITGATGFTGSWLTERLLKDGASVAILLVDSNPDIIFFRKGLSEQVHTIPGSILDFDLLARTVAQLRIDTVFHLAGVSVEGLAHHDPIQAFEVNIRGTYHLLEACRLNARTVSKVIVASSDKVYGDNPDLPYRETMPLLGNHPYDVSKACADMLARSYHHNYGLPVAVARFASIFGGGDLNFSRLVPNTIRRLLQGEPPIIRKPQSDVFKRDFLYISDQVRAYIALFHAMDRPAVWGQAFNFGMGRCLAIPDVVAGIQRLMGLENIVPREEPAQHGEILRQQVLCEKANRELGWSPVYSMQEGLTETIEWYRQYFQSTALRT